MLRITPLAALILSAAGAAQAQSAPNRNSFEGLNQFSEGVQQLAARVAPSVVQITVTRYGAQEDSSGQTSAVLSRQQVVGSGAIIDPSGYIVTNAHVVNNALRIRVARAPQAAQKSDQPDQVITNTLAQAIAPE